MFASENVFSVRLNRICSLWASSVFCCKCLWWLVSECRMTIDARAVKQWLHMGLKCMRCARIGECEQRRFYVCQYGWITQISWNRNPSHVWRHGAYRPHHTLEHFSRRSCVTDRLFLCPGYCFGRLFSYDSKPIPSNIKSTLFSTMQYLSSAPRPCLCQCLHSVCSCLFLSWR